VKEAHWACVDRVSGAQLNVDIMNEQDTRPRNPGNHSPNVPIASASRAPAPSSAGEAVTDLRSASSVRIDLFCAPLFFKETSKVSKSQKKSAQFNLLNSKKDERRNVYCSAPYYAPLQHNK